MELRTLQPQVAVDVTLKCKVQLHSQVQAGFIILRPDLSPWRRFPTAARTIQAATRKEETSNGFRAVSGGFTISSPPIIGQISYRGGLRLFFNADEPR